MSSFLSPQFAERLRGGKYSRWVTQIGFSEEHLECLLWIVGEFSAGASRVLDLLYEARVQRKVDERAYLALEALQWVVYGERFSVDRWAQRITRGGSPLQVTDLPGAVRPALHALTRTWDRVLEIGSDYELIGKDAQGRPLYAYVSAAGSVTHSGAERQKGQLKDSSLVPAAVDERLSRGKCTAWAAARGFPEEEMRCLFWLVYEFACRSHSVLDLLEREKHQLSGQERAVLALQAMTRITGERFDTGELLRRMARGRVHMEYEELPGALRAAVEHAAPGFTWRSAMMRPDHYLVAGSGPEAKQVQAQVMHDGKVALRIYLEEPHLPQVVVAAAKSELPGCEILMAESVGPALGAIEGYELLVGPPNAPNRKLVISADGRVTSVA